MEISELLGKYLRRTASPAERDQLFAMIQDESRADELAEALLANWQNFHTEEGLPEGRSGPLFQAILLAGRALAPLSLPEKKVKVRTLYRTWIGWAAAAVLLLFAGWFFIRDKGSSGGDEAITRVEADVSAPASQKATITLGDGRLVSLDSVSKGLLVQMGNIRLVKEADGQIAYEAAAGVSAGEIPNHTLSNPRGSQVIDMRLSDGSHVWLNAGSTITYPVAFVGNQRQVTVTGEAYFEVAKDANRPFSVTRGDMVVQVLGTHFNVQAYADAEAGKVTLVEGSVRVQAGGKDLLLKPGQQAVVKGPSLERKTEVDLEAVLAWKNGYFHFDYTPVEEVLRELSRWYDLEVVYEQGVPDIQLWGQIKRDLTLSQVLRGLGKIGVHFRIEGRKLVVLPEPEKK